MSLLLEAEKTVSQLSPKDLGQFRDWFNRFVSKKQEIQAKSLLKTPTHAHPTLSNIGINYDPTEPFSDEEWVGEK